MPKSQVSIVKTGADPNYDQVLAAVRRAVDMVGGMASVVKPGQKVLINPSWVASPADRGSGACTWPEISRAIADLVREAGGEAVIAESSAVGVDCEKVIRESGHGDLRELGYPVVNLKEYGRAELPVPGGGRIFDPMPVFKLVAEADVIITAPVLKTHDQTEMTCSIKKLKGLLPDKTKRAFHQQGLFDAVVDLLAATKPALTVVDAIICQEGVGPVFGDPIEMDLVLASKDLVACDSVCSRLIGYDPEDIKLTVNAAARGLGVMDPEKIEILGEDLASVSRRFVRAVEANPVGEVDGFKLIYGEDACTGCRNTVMSALIDIKNGDQLIYLPGVTVVAGAADSGVDIASLPGEVVTVGTKCTPKDKRGIRHADGCPPNNIDVVKAIIGARAEAKRMYADDPESD